MGRKKKICISEGNTKLGKVQNFSLPQGVTCPGKSPWCKNCYVNRYTRRFKVCRKAYERNLKYSQKDSFSDLVIDKIRKETENTNVRIHPSGDFYSVEYIEHWIKICRELKNYNFWCYTRSWIIPELFSKIQKLNEIENVQVFLSTDPTMDLPSEGFRIAFIEDDERANGIICLHDAGLKKTCNTCGYCFKNKEGNVIFKNKLKRNNK